MKQPETEESLESFFQRLQPKMRSLLARYCIPPQEAERLLRDVFLTLLYKRETIAVPDRWLLLTLRRQCMLFWASRKWQLFANLDTALLEIRRPQDAEQQLLLERELEAVLATLPEACRQTLVVRYRGESRVAAAGQAAAPPRDEVERCLALLSRRLLEAGLFEEEHLVN